MAASASDTLSRRYFFVTFFQRLFSLIFIFRYFGHADFRRRLGCHCRFSFAMLDYAS
jgi:hypothetical protein